MRNYLYLLRHVKEDGKFFKDRTGVGCTHLFGESYTINLDANYYDGNLVVKEFPFLTTKFVSLRIAFHELMWKLSGESNIKYLLENDVHIWTDWLYEYWLKAQGIDVTKLLNSSKSEHYQDLKKVFEQLIVDVPAFAKQWGNMGNSYGYQFRKFNGSIDQVANALEMISSSPESRRNIITLWNPSDVEHTPLPPCDTWYQFDASVPGELSLVAYQRSADLFLGVPYNDAEDCMMLCLFAILTKRVPKKYTHMFGNVHIYANHMKQVDEQLKREPYTLPSLSIVCKDDLMDYKIDDFKLDNYQHHPKLKAPVAV